jgi:hypothetical protein
MSLRGAALLATVALLAGLCALALSQRTPSAGPPRKPNAAAPVAPSGERSSALRTLVIAGGAMPDSSEVSLEQNAQLALEVLPGPSELLFAGGAGTEGVRVAAPRSDATATAEARTLAKLGALFAPRPSRDSRYRKTWLAPAAAAQRAEIERVLRRAFAQPVAPPLLVYVAAHGEQGEVARDNAFVTWGNETLSAAELAALHDEHARPLVLVATSCFSGGFAELAFEAADEARGPSRAPRCALLAGTWDRETSGCDPNPERSVQESYSLHMLSALAQRDRDAKPLALAMLDLDHDGRVSLLEAHARARVAAQSIDVPTTTSERFLRSLEAKLGTRAATSTELAAFLPEESAVARALSAKLELQDEAAAQRKLAALDAARIEHTARVADAEAALDAAYWPLATLVLERYPVLDDAFHPDFAATLRAHAAAVDDLLTHAPQARAHAAANDALARLDETALTLELEEAHVLRLARAFETLRLARRLLAAGGTGLARYSALLACERGP